MKQFDYEKIILIYKKKQKMFLVLFIVSLILIALIFALGLLISNYQNQTIIMVIFSILLSLLSIPSISLFIFGYLKYKKELKQIYFILGGYLTTLSGEVIAFKNEITTITGRKGKEIVFKNKNEEQIILYFDLIFNEIPFKIGDKLIIKSSESFIIRYGVDND